MFNLAFLRSRKFFIHGTNIPTVLHCSIQFRNGPSFEKSICLWLTQIYKLYRKIIVLIAYRTWEQLRLKTFICEKAYVNTTTTALLIMHS